MTRNASSRSESAEAERLRAQMVENLIAEQALRTQPWISAFAAVPRHMFVPAFLRESEFPLPPQLIDSHDQDVHSEWLRAVYTDDALVTQVGTDGKVTSSSTSPGLMAVMLEGLGIAPGMRVLEIGTGTGYNAALLCHRLGSDLVTSIDIDRDLVDGARGRLAALGYTPQLVMQDGVTGYEPNAPYQRIIATVSVPQIPRAWIIQSARGSRILANLHRELGGGALVLLTAYGEHAKGMFLAQYGGFMPVRTYKLPTPVSLMRAARDTDCERRGTIVVGKVLDDPAFAFFAAMLVGGQRLEYEPEGRSEEFWLLGADGSWARQTTDARGALIVDQHGPHLLWDELEHAHAQWVTLGCPPRWTFGLTVAADGTHTLWSGQSHRTPWRLAIEFP